MLPPPDPSAPAQPIRIGVVGVGAIGRNHARILAALPGVELAAIWDASPDQLHQVAAQVGLPQAATSSLEELASRCDAATVATPTSTHLEIASQLLHAGLHVLVEKPIADKLADALTLVELAHQAGRILQVGHIERFNPVLAELEARLTHPRFIEAHRLSPFPNRSTDIGVVLDLMIHDLEIILHLVRSPIVSIDAVGVPVLTRREDIANARLRFEDGCVANITASRISPEKLRKIRVFQEDCYLSLDYQEQAGQIFRRSGTEIVQEPVAVEKDEPLRRELAAFADCARAGRQPQVSGREAAAALDLALEITRLIAANPTP